MDINIMIYYSFELKSHCPLSTSIVAILSMVRSLINTMSCHLTYQKWVLSQEFTVSKPTPPPTEYHSSFIVRWLHNVPNLKWAFPLVIWVSFGRIKSLMLVSCTTRANWSVMRSSPLVMRRFGRTILDGWGIELNLSALEICSTW